MSKETSNKNINRWIALTAVALVIVLSAEAAFILYLRNANIANQEAVKQASDDYAMEDSLCRINEANSKHYTKAEESLLTQKDEVDDYVSSMVQEELQTLEDEENGITVADTTSSIEDWGEDDPVEPAEPDTTAIIMEE